MSYRWAQAAGLHQQLSILLPLVQNQSECSVLPSLWFSMQLSYFYFFIAFFFVSRIQLREANTISRKILLKHDLGYFYTFVQQLGRFYYWKCYESARKSTCVYLLSLVVLLYISYIFAEFVWVLVSNISKPTIWPHLLYVTTKCW